jgi:hypothetical protein
LPSSETGLRIRAISWLAFCGFGLALSDKLVDRFRVNSDRPTESNRWQFAGLDKVVEFPYGNAEAICGLASRH